MMETLCQKCDVFVGFDAVGVAKVPEEHKGDNEWLMSHCWVCRRSRAEIERDPRGRDEVSDQTPIDRYIRSYDGVQPRDGITRDVAFNRKSFGENQPENPAQGDIHVGLDGIRAELVQDYDDQDLQRVCTFAINATRGIDPENPPDPVDWEEMLQGGLQTALEDFRIAFAVYGVSRTCTHQIVRTRLAAFHQQSQRAHSYGDRPSVRMPESFVGELFPITDEEYWMANIRLDPKPYLSGGAVITSLAAEYESLAEHAAWFYRLATKRDVSYQDARFCLLEGTENFIMWEGSLREFINVYAYRGCSMFQWEIVQVFREMRRVLVEAHPYLDKYVKISCEKTHGALDGPQTPGAGARAIDNAQGKPIILRAGSSELSHTCTYQGWEVVDDQCDFPWARETNRTFRSTHHRIEKGKS
jgi:thymidylate synthase (FAD)